MTLIPTTLQTCIFTKSLIDSGTVTFTVVVELDEQDDNTKSLLLSYLANGEPANVTLDADCG